MESGSLASAGAIGCTTVSDPLAPSPLETCTGAAATGRGRNMTRGRTIACAISWSVSAADSGQTDKKKNGYLRETIGDESKYVHDKDDDDGKRQN